MDDPFAAARSHRAWRRDGGALAAGVCAGLAEDLDLPPSLIRVVALAFMVLPTGLAYLALALLLRRRETARATMQPMAERSGRPGRAGPRSATQGRGETWALLRQRFDMLEPRLTNIEAFVTSKDFELHRGFRRMGQ